MTYEQKQPTLRKIHRLSSLTLVLCCLLFCRLGVATGYDFQLGFEPTGNKNFDYQIRAIINQEVSPLLPEKLKRDLNRTITVRFKPFKKFVPINSLEDCLAPSLADKNLARLADPTDSWGDRRLATTIQVNPALTDLLVNRDLRSVGSCRHFNAHYFLAALILNQLARAYDNLSFDTEDRERLRVCKALHRDRSNGRYTNQDCRKLVKRRFRVSDSRLYLRLGYFERGILEYRSKQRTHIYESKQPRQVTLGKVPFHDPRELTNPRNHFAANFEYFILDPTYSCTRPATVRYFSEVFDYSPRKACNTDLQLSVATEENAWESINAEDIYQIQFAYIEPCSDDIACNWGHSAFILVRCAPHRTQVSEKCLEDTEHHLFIDFKANSTNYGIEGEGLDHFWAGINGTYAGQLHTFRYEERVQNYGDEDRRIISYPLDFSYTEKQRFLELVFESYLIYRSYWRQLSNNCVNQAGDFIGLATRDMITYNFGFPNTPRVVVERILDSGLSTSLSD